MRPVLLLIAALLLGACTSMQSAGVADYTVRPIVLGEKTLCCEVSIKNGKEYARLKARIEKTGDDYRVELEEETVQAFAGQQKAADVVTKAVDAAATVGVSAIVGPAGIGALGTGLKAIAP